MDKHVLGIYLCELESQSLMALNAVNVLGQISTKGSKDVESMSPEQRLAINKEYFRSIHSYLTHLSNISRLIWPPALSPKQHCFCNTPRAKSMVCGICVARERSKSILSALELGESEHVLKSRILRGHLEHFDERVDHWMQTNQSRNYVQDYIGPKGEIQGLEEADIMRHYDPGSGDFTFRGETHGLVALLYGLEDVLRRTLAAIKRARSF
jgi:hypothetical protein